VVRRDQDALCELALQRHAPQVRVCGIDFRIHIAKAGRGKSEVAARTREGTVVARGNGQGQLGRGYADSLIVRRILNDVKRNIAEVPLVADAVPAAECRLAVAEHIPGEADARSEVLPILFPKAADGTIGSELDRPARDTLRSGR